MIMMRLCPHVLLLISYLLLLQTCTTSTEGNSKGDPDSSGQPTGDGVNKQQENGEKKKYYENIRKFHKEMDNDNDGEINVNESTLYLKTRNVEGSVAETRQSSHFHNNDDHISVDDLWKKWLDSPAYAWAVEDVVKWLDNTVKLRKYADIFRAHGVLGKNMPQLATDKSKYLKDELKISNKFDRKKITLHASSLILFGMEESPPQDKEDSRKDDPNFHAIKVLHVQLDDNSDGEISSNESTDFVTEDLQIEVKPEHRAMHTHDSYISLDEFWHQWENSKVYNWTNDDVVAWLRSHVGLPEYEGVFREKQLYGKSIPRLATDNKFLQKDLGISVGAHRKKINVRASEIILFGLPEGNTNFFSDTIVLLTVLVASLLIFYAFHQKTMSRRKIEKLTNDLEFLKQAEHQLRELQENEGGGVSKEKELLLREEIEAAKKEAERLHQEQSKHEQEKTKLQLLEREVRQLQMELAQAKRESLHGAPLGLQNLLILTYRKEVQNFHLRKQQALSQMQLAKEACEKVNKTRRAVFGSLRLAHGQSIDAVDQKILNAKTALAEVTKDLQERQNRWQQIEGVCNFSIVSEENNMQRVMLSDTLLFGSKGQVGGLDGYDSPLLGLTDIEQLDQLDNEVEAITRKGRLIRSGTDSSSSPENQGKNGHVAEGGSVSALNHNHSPNSIKLDSPKGKSPKLFRRSGGMKSNNSYDNLALSDHGSSSSLDILIGGSSIPSCSSLPAHMNAMNAEDSSPPKDGLIKRKNLPSYARSNTDPSVVGAGTPTSTNNGSMGGAEGNGSHSPNLRELPAGKQRTGSRPSSFVEKDVKKKKKGLSLPKFGNSSS